MIQPNGHTPRHQSGNPLTGDLSQPDSSAVKNQRTMVLYGEGPGDKAGQLSRRADHILQAGFYLNRKIVLGCSLVKKIADYSGLHHDRGYSHEDALSALGAPEAVKLLATFVGKIPLNRRPYWEIRSSGVGDSRGTGAYKSHRVPGEYKCVLEATKSVIASYYSYEGKIFRERANLPDGFAVSAEPSLGTNYGPKRPRYFCPIAGGFGYTSDSLHGPHLRAVLGFGNQAVCGGDSFLISEATRGRDGERTNLFHLLQDDRLGLGYTLKAQVIELQEPDGIDSYLSAEALTRRHLQGLEGLECQGLLF